MKRLSEAASLTRRKKRNKTTFFLPSKGYIVFDLELCTGCHVCKAICSFVKEGSVRPEASRIQVRVKPFAGTVENYAPQPCLQCDTPYCMMACPVDGAMSIDEETGARLIHSSKCPKGCRKCMEACGSYFEPPRIIVHPERRICVKCDLCEGIPECVKWCPNGALRYISYSEFVEKGRVYNLSFTEAFDKDFGPTFELFEGQKWRYRGPWLGED